MTEEEAKKRLAMIAKKQELLGKAVGILQEKLFQAVLDKIENIAEDPAAMNRLFDEFTANEHAKVLQNFASDIISIGAMNAEYFIEAAANIGAKNYQAIQGKANDQILQRFGLDKKGKMIKGGFIDSFASDTTIKRQLTQYAYKTKMAGAGVQEFKAGFKDLIIGDKTKNGALLKYYNTFAFDTYQQVDSSLQQLYSEELGLEAFLYLGGLIAGSRPFCNERNGKVFLKEEIDSWKKLEFAGKPANYTPFLDRGGYNCRHILNAITAKMAVARRSDLEIGDDGKLRKKGAAPAEEVKIEEESFKEAETIEEAKVQHLEMARKTGLNVDSVKFDTSLNLDQINTLGKNLDLLVSEYEISKVYIQTNKMPLVYESKKGYYGYIATNRRNNQIFEINLGSTPKIDRGSSRKGMFESADFDGGKDLLYTQTHEFGHLISLSKQELQGDSRVDLFWPELKKIKAKYSKEINGYTKSGNFEKVSEISLGRYASTNADEFMAEAFAEYKQKTKPSKYALLVGELIDKNFKRK